MSACLPPSLYFCILQARVDEGAHTLKHRPTIRLFCVSCVSLHYENTLTYSKVIRTLSWCVFESFNGLVSYY